jgi:Tfp pilus assembly PilM family ATPase
VNVLSLIASVDSEMENRAAFAEEGELAPEPEVEPEVEVEVEPEQVDPEPKVEPAPPKVTPLPKNAFAELKIPDAEIDDIGDWLDELGALEVVTEIPVSEVVTEIPVSEVVTEIPVSELVTEIPVSELVTETDLSGVDFPESSKGSFTFDGEVAADFEAVLDRVEAPALHKPPTKRGVLLVADDDDVDALMDLFGDP